MLSKQKLILLAVVASALVPGAALASSTSYSDFTLYNTASGPSTTTENYGTQTAGTLIPGGTTVDGLTYDFTGSGGLDGIVTNQFNSLSGNSLGLNETLGAQFFFGGDSFTVDFAQPVYSAGAYFNVNANSGNYFVDTSAGDTITGSSTYDTSTFVFAGIVSTTPFTSATFGSTDGALGSFNIPGIFYADDAAVVPEPSPLEFFALAGIGLAGLILRARKRTA